MSNANSQSSSPKQEAVAQQPSLLSALRSVLLRREKLGLIVALVMTIVNSFLEIAALAILLPLTNQLLGGDRKTIELLELIFPDSLSEETRLLAILSVVITIYVLKNAFSLTLVYTQQRLGAAIANRLTRRLFAVYLSRPYAFHLRTNSSILIRNVQENAGALLSYVIIPVLVILTDVSVALAVLSLLLYLEFLGTLATIAVFGIGTWLFLRVSAPITRQWGSIRNQAREQATKVLLEGLGGVKEIKLFGREDVFLAEHARHQVRSQRVTYLFATFQQFPRSVFEVLAFMGMGAMIAVLILAGRPAADAVGVLAVFAAAAFRILPSLSRVTTSFQHLSFGRAMVFSVYDDLIEEPDLTTPREFPTKTQFNSLTLENVTFVYDAASRPALENLSISIGSGEYVGVIGSSGAGKSTLIDVLLGLLEVSRGKVLLNGQPIKDDIAQWRGIVGYVPQDIYLLDDTIRRNIALDIRDAEIDDESVETALRAAQLWEFVQSLPEGLETETGERGVRLSGGQRQRLGIARALYRRPQVLVFDEATSALDSQTEQEVIEAIEQLRGERTVIVVAHRLSTVRMCDRLYLLESGRVVNSGTYEQVLGSS